MRRDLEELVKHRDLLYMLVWRDIRVKYKQSVMGFMWAVFMPVLIVLAGMLVRFGFSRVSGQTLDWADIATVCVKAVPWAFFVASVRFSTQSLIANTNLVTKIYFPRELFPLAATLAQLFDLAVASIALAAILAIGGVGVSLQLLWVPVLLLLLVVFVLALGILLSALALFFRDVKFIVEVLLTFGIFFTPVFYDVGMFGEWAAVLLLNPLAPILEGLSAAIVEHRAPAPEWLLYSAVVSLLGLVLAHRIFRNLEPAFAENI